MKVLKKKMYIQVRQLSSWKVPGWNYNRQTRPMTLRVTFFLKQKQLRQHFEVLGWNCYRWENSDPPPSNGKSFADLSPPEQVVFSFFVLGILLVADQ